MSGRNSFSLVKLSTHDKNQWDKPWGGVRRTDLKYPRPTLWSVLQEASALFAGRLLQPALVVHVRQALGAPDLSAAGFVVGPDAVQSHLGPSADAESRFREHQSKAQTQTSVPQLTEQIAR